MSILVCDQCGHVSPHEDGPTLTVPYQPPGTTRHVDRATRQCERPRCFCNLHIPRDLLPSEPVL